MAFSFLVLVSIGFALLVVGLLVAACIVGNDEYLAGSFFAAVLLFIFGGFTAATWQGHADNIATVHYQQPVIDTLTERVEGLTERLTNFDYPRTALVNRDTPVASLVASLSQAEAELSAAKMAQGEAIRALEATRLGPMSGLFYWVGDYK